MSGERRATAVAAWLGSDGAGRDGIRAGPTKEGSPDIFVGEESLALTRLFPRSAIGKRRREALSIPALEPGASLTNMQKAFKRGVAVQMRDLRQRMERAQRVA